MTRLAKLLCVLCLASATAWASTTWYVNGTSGSDSNNCLSSATPCKTIGHAISLSNSGDMVIVAAAIYRENLTVSKSLNLVGSGASTTIIDGGGVGTVVYISSTSASVALSKFTIRNGNAALHAGGGINNSGILLVSRSRVTGNSAGWGGGFYNSGSLTLANSTVSGNTAAGLIFRGARGGGIYNSGQLTIEQSTLNNNVAYSANYLSTGGAISAGGVVVISNSTIAGNSATGGVGGIFTGGYGEKLTISNSTITGNIGALASGVYVVAGNGYAALQNTILANNSAGNCSGVISMGYNLSSDRACNFNGPGDMNNINPLLGGLQNNGGPTQTQALLSGSPAIDAGNPSGCTDGQGHLLKTDQRGMPRPDSEDTLGCDIGAYERQSD